MNRWRVTRSGGSAGFSDEIQRNASLYRRPTNLGAPRYGEDDVWVLTELLGRTPSEVEQLAAEGVI